MSHYGLEEFLAETRAAVAHSGEPADCVEAVAPLLHRLINGSRDFLKPEHFRPEPNHYARNAIHIDEADGLSLYSLVWTPGQWTPVHDHGTWGVVGVVRGVLEERNLIRVDPDHNQDIGIDLRRGGPILLGEGTVTTFVPNPDHIHMTGVPEGRAQTVSLHLYGRAMNSFHVYDVAAGTRERIEVFHNES
jgi:predicted metal-dependent enzyme (double-stranded beta helix superfamily)